MTHRRADVRAVCPFVFEEPDPALLEWWGWKGRSLLPPPGTASITVEITSRRGAH